MPAHTYKVIQLVGSSESNVEDAIHGALARASETIRELEWFEVKNIRGIVGDGGKVTYFQVTLDVGFRVLDASDVQRG